MSQQGAKLPEKKKNDLLRKFLNAQEYTKTLKKSAMHMTDDLTYAPYSYDEIQSYPEIPQSAKLPSMKTISKEFIYSIDTLKDNNSHDFTSKPKVKKSHGYSNMTQSSSEIPYLKNKKSSYSEIEKSQPSSKGIKGDIVELQAKLRARDYDVKSMKKEKQTYQQPMHGSTGVVKTDSFFKPKSKTKLSNLHEFESEKLSVQEEQSFQYKRTYTKPYEKQSNEGRKQPSYEQCPYDLSPSNFTKLINKVEQLQGVIQMYQSAIQELRKKILNLQQEKNSSQISQIYIDSLKQELFEEKSKNAQLRENIHHQESYLKQYQESLIGSVEKIGRFYETEISKIIMLEKENQFLKFMLRLQVENQNPEMLKTEVLQDVNNAKDDQKSSPTLAITRNLGQFKQKFTKLVQKKTEQNQPNC